jgi:hypothetical protein
MQFRFSRQCLSVLLQNLGSSSQPFTMALASSAHFFFVSMASLDPTFLQRAPTTHSAGLVSPDMGMRSFRKKKCAKLGFDLADGVCFYAGMLLYCSYNRVLSESKRKAICPIKQAE